MKKFLVFIFFLSLWFIGNLLFKVDLPYYQKLELPFSLPTPIFIISWSIIYILISIVNTYIYCNFNKHEIKEYFRSFLFNYITHILFTYFFFTMKSPFLGFTDSVILFISTLICYYEVQELEPKLTKFFIPYLILVILATIFLLCTIFLNL